ncbi:MAG TPA: hypothetical protein VEI97_06545, partial [bacterium]|nr:hypothetical protein [bacterium]
VTYLVDRSTGAVESRMADIILSTSTTARLRAHDAALATDGTLRIAGLEQSGGNNSVPNITYAVVGSSFTTVPTLRTVQPAVITQEPPAILVSGSDPVWIAYAGEDGAAVERIDGPTLAVPAIGGEVFVRNIDLALNPQVPDQLLVLVQQASGSTLENLRGTLQFFTAPWDLAALMPFDGGAVPSSVLPSVDNGPGNVVAGIGAIHVIWQENGIGQNRNTRILEARTN